MSAWKYHDMASVKVARHESSDGILCGRIDTWHLSGNDCRELIRQVVLNSNELYFWHVVELPAFAGIPGKRGRPVRPANLLGVTPAARADSSHRAHWCGNQHKEHEGTKLSGENSLHTTVARAADPNSRNKRPTGSVVSTSRTAVPKCGWGARARTGKPIRYSPTATTAKSSLKVLLFYLIYSF